MSFYKDGTSLIGWQGKIAEFDGGHITLYAKLIAINTQKYDLDLKKYCRWYAVSFMGAIHWNGGEREGGQVLNTLEKMFYENKLKYIWPADKIKELIYMWNTWHMNDCIPGCRAQEEYLSAQLPKQRRLNYSEKIEFLKEAGLEPCKISEDLTYAYGSKWLLKPVEQEVFDFFTSLENL